MHIFSFFFIWTLQEVRPHISCVIADRALDNRSRTGTLGRLPQPHSHKTPAPSNKGTQMRVRVGVCVAMLALGFQQGQSLCTSSRFYFFVLVCHWLASLAVPFMSCRVFSLHALPPCKPKQNKQHSTGRCARRLSCSLSLCQAASLTSI